MNENKYITENENEYIAEIDDDGTLSDFLAPLLRAEKRYNALIKKKGEPIWI